MSSADLDTPAASGFRMPAEWEPHQATWLAWPHQRSDWPGKFSPIPWVYAEIVRHLVQGERIRILVRDAREERSASSVLGKAGVDLSKVDFFRVRTDRAWTRDYCPIFLKRTDGSMAIANWKFNGWAKYDDNALDERVTDQLARALRLPQWKPSLQIGTRRRRIVLEGGSIDVNGAGALLTTEECLLSPVQARNPGISKEELEQVLRDYLGVRKILWLAEGIAGDDTHGHVDDVARFTDSHTVVVAEEENEGDPNADRLRANRKLLETMSDQDGHPLRVVTLPMPAPIYFNNQRLPASYVNFYIGNAAVLVPTFNDPKDRQALQTLSELFPDRQVIGIHAVDLVLGLGTLHCMTQQQPSGVPHPHSDREMGNQQKE